MTSEIDREITFEKALEKLLNQYCKENASNTPDYVLSSYLCDCLSSFNHAVKRREDFYGRVV